MLLTQQRRSDPSVKDAPAARVKKPRIRRTRSGPTLRIATYNIHKGISPLYGRNRIHDLRQRLSSLDADIVFLQEVQGRSERHAARFHNWPSSEQHHYLAASLWEHSAYGRNVVRADGDHGNALLSRFPMLEAENLDVSHHRFEGRGILHCTIDVSGHVVHCLCAHFGLLEQSRRHQVEALIERVRETVPDDAALVIAGDFNDWRNRLGSVLSRELHVKEVFELVPAKAPVGALRPMPQIFSGGPGSGIRALSILSGAWFDRILPARTFPAAFPLLRLDRVYLRGFEVTSAAVAHGPAWRKLSDHAPIIADLRVI
jgi:endonuclease/exonuclease/phosphatase family metal-dependent hydrolase